MRERSRSTEQALERTAASERELEEILSRAVQLPGVRELQELMARVPRVPAEPVKPAIRYATGANS